MPDPIPFEIVLRRRGMVEGKLQTKPEPFTAPADYFEYLTRSSAMHYVQIDQDAAGWYVDVFPAGVNRNTIKNSIATRYRGLTHVKVGEGTKGNYAISFRAAEAAKTRGPRRTRLITQVVPPVAGEPQDLIVSLRAGQSVKDITEGGVFRIYQGGLLRTARGSGRSLTVALMHRRAKNDAVFLPDTQHTGIRDLRVEALPRTVRRGRQLPMVRLTFTPALTYKRPAWVRMTTFEDLTGVAL